MTNAAIAAALIASAASATFLSFSLLPMPSAVAFSASRSAGEGCRPSNGFRNGAMRERTAWMSKHGSNRAPSASFMPFAARNR